MRNKLFLIFFFIAVCFVSIAQENNTYLIQRRCDSIINLFIKEKNENKKADLIINLYGTAVDGFPLLLLKLSQKLQDEARQRKDIFCESAAYTAAGQANRLTGNYVKALELHRKAVSLAEQSGNKLLIGFAINQMAHIYKDRLENKKALSLYREAIQNFEAAGRNDIWYTAMNIAVVNYNMGNYDTSLYYSKIALSRTDINPGFGTKSTLFLNFAGIYSQKNNQDSVKKYFSLALNATNRSQSPRYLNQAYIAIAEHFNRKQQFDSSVYYYKKAVEIVSGTEMNSLVLKPAKKLTDYYQNINSDSTVKYWKVYSIANDSVNSIRANQQIQMLTFEEEQRKNDIEAAKIAYQNKIRFGLMLGGLTVFLLVAIILYRNNLQKQKANRVLEATLTNLKSTQSQLIQSEKMASLGELAAGIAHEIQNPLNFVNNFSEVNKELLEELKAERLKPNAERKEDIENELIDDVISNEEKINHHGKRADAIVKGMLQHSRSSSGQKEPTDINALCDEYLRLAYHGLRAKDKSFNASLETHFDDSIGLVKMQSQEMGRVILNLINNAFYAVAERNKNATENYEPKVIVTTEKKDNRILISVKDNGTGIPQKVVDKIFQPFFTTKPTGEGTGLGLSLSYDIVKAHGGDLKVNTKEGEGSEFIIQLTIS